MQYGGILGIIHIIIFIWALVQILGSSMPLVNKIIWLLVVGLLPIVGLIIYLLIGRKA
ncbi:hypothetical protein GW846_05710 [Candidatus Gracilibacteria bacterium]|nr:hypothetical protein [Candidatus Gracilibacteria bacterium]